MQDGSDEYGLRLSFLEKTEPDSLNVARLCLEMASRHGPEHREDGIRLFDRADRIFARHLATSRDAAIAGLALSLNNRAALELDCEEWEWAIDASSQAVALRRDRLRNCVGRGDDVERIDLGFSLAALALACRGGGKFDLARDAAVDAILVLQKFAGMHNEDAFVLLAKLICMYMELCLQTHQVPDTELLLPLAKAFYSTRKGRT
ncbi:hypothetical protein LPB41_07330 [Thalassospira sp. MA62]|nr:hypothetical protein [Thalassospira sp. MA62]